MVDSTTNPNYQWHLRYNASSTSTYKWEFVGGAEFSGYSAANVNLGSTVNTFANIVGGSTIAIPRSGEYILRSKCVAVNAAAATFYTVLWFGSLSSTVGDQSQAGVSAAGGWSTELITGPYKGILAGGNGLGVAGQCNAVNGSFQQITWSMIPYSLASSALM